MPPSEPWHGSVDDSAQKSFFKVSAVPDQPVVVDSLIGQVNGRPVYAEEVLAPLMDRLRALYLEESYETFQRQLVSLVGEQLQAVLYNELLVAESRAELTPDQQGGLLGFLNELRDEAVRKRGGVQREAERRLIEEEGKTMDQYIDAEEQKILIGELLRNQIEPRTFVSWRDIERSYRARIKEFQPDPTVGLGRIRLRTEGNESQIELIQGELKAGESFEVVARQAGMKDDGFWERFVLPAEGLEALPIADVYKPHLKSLEPGDVSDAFQRGKWTLWVSVLYIDRPTPRTLDDADVQRMLQQQIQMARGADEERRLLDRLIDQGIYDEMSDMTARAIRVAISRFPPPR